VKLPLIVIDHLLVIALNYESTAGPALIGRSQCLIDRSRRSLA